MTPWFIATEKFGPEDKVKWDKYIAWSKLSQLNELVSLDSMLCPSVLASSTVPDDYWAHIVNEDFMLNYFVDLGFLESQITNRKNFNLLCVVINPNTTTSRDSAPNGFIFLGYDLVEGQTGVSALTNCGGFPEVFNNDELSEKGLLAEFSRALEVKTELAKRFPEEPHANCNVWAIFRKEA